MIELNNINERIAYVVETSGLTKSAFAKKINVSPAFVSLVCKGGSSVSDRTISDICREFKINELWLRTGEGSVVHIPSRKEQIAAYMGELLGGQRTPAEEILITAMSEMSEESIQVMVQMMDHISHLWCEQVGEEKWKRTHDNLYRDKNKHEE